MDERDARRWRAALARPPILSARAPFAFGARWPWCRAPGLPLGRFLFRWGYVEVGRYTLRYVPGTDLGYELVRRRIGSTGAWPHAVRIFADDWSTTFPLSSHREVDVPIEALASLGFDRLDLERSGYRGLRPLSAAAPRDAVGRAALVAAVVSLGVVACVGIARAAFAHERAEPIDLSPCSDTPESRARVLGSGSVADAERSPRSLGSAEHITVRCSWTGAGAAGPILRAHARWSLERDGRARLDREISLDPHRPGALGGACGAFEPDRPPRDRVVLAALIQLEDAIARDIVRTLGSRTFRRTSHVVAAQARVCLLGGAAPLELRPLVGPR